MKINQIFEIPKLIIWRCSVTIRVYKRNFELINKCDEENINIIKDKLMIKQVNDLFMLMIINDKVNDASKKSLIKQN